jgi:hypothetical protein
MDIKTLQYSKLIDFMLDDSCFIKSKEFLQSVKKYIADNDKITEGQIKALNNIYVKSSGIIK